MLPTSYLVFRERTIKIVKPLFVAAGLFCFLGSALFAQTPTISRIVDSA